ncbi:hypothetical protein RYH80_07015 [Halobaculum sp. MBLA0147]|uniref:hypothetical protein n=1 Tax=Halobaculum sp. MBLA0147 TaxID=3079934 RepID=UPI003523D070
MNFSHTSKIAELNKRINHWHAGVDYNAAGTHIFEEDWDNLVILDACRFDVFSAHHPFEGRLESRISRGSTTKEFIRANFREERRLDTAYLSDNGWYGRLFEQLDSHLYDFQLCSRDAFDGAVSHPTTVTDAARAYTQEHPNKRLIVHYLQPHDPYFDRNGDERFALVSSDPRELAQAGYSAETIADAYIESFEYVATEVQKLLKELHGKTVITADHGELLGERMRPIPARCFEHPEGVYVDELVKVPWFIADFDERKTIQPASEPTDWEYTDPHLDDVESQLEQLGYL